MKNKTLTNDEGWQGYFAAGIIADLTELAGVRSNRRATESLLHPDWVKPPPG
jgi:hypothetical protein